MSSKEDSTSQAIGSKTTTLIVSIIILCVITVVFVLAITFIKPDTDNTPIILLIIGIIVPVITALLAVVVQQVHLAVNGRLSQLLSLTAVSSKAEGIVEGVREEKADVIKQKKLIKGKG